SGLGPVIARRLHTEGVRFVLSARRRPELEGLARELVGSRVVVADLARRGEAERLATEAGPVDILIANAGVPVSGTLASLGVGEMDGELEVNPPGASVSRRLPRPAMLARL